MSTPSLPYASRMGVSKPKRVRSKPVLFAEVPPDLLDWLDSLAVPGEKPNRSFHTRQALRLYREGGPDKVAAMLASLDEQAAAAQRRDLDEDQRELLEAFERLDRKNQDATDAALRVIRLAADPRLVGAIRGFVAALEDVAALTGARESGRSAAAPRGQAARRNVVKGTG